MEITIIPEGDGYTYERPDASDAPAPVFATLEEAVEDAENTYPGAIIHHSPDIREE